jgi:hypothetical protein
MMDYCFYYGLNYVPVNMQAAFRGPLKSYLKIIHNSVIPSTGASLKSALITFSML